VQGLLGTNSGWAREFQLPNGSFLQPLGLLQPLGDDGLLDSFANAWRVAPGASLLDDSPALLQFVSAIAGAPGPADAAPHDLGAPLQGANSPSAADFLAGAYRP
jgi:hypothetical protein